MTSTWGDWKPDVVEQQLGESTYYYWVLPADTKGRWHISVPSLGKDGEYIVEVVQNFQVIQVTLLTKLADTSITQAKINGDTISFFLGKGRGKTRRGYTSWGRCGKCHLRQCRGRNQSFLQPSCDGRGNVDHRQSWMDGDAQQMKVALAVEN